MPDTDIVALSFKDLASRMDAGALSSEALVRECLSRIARLDGALHAFVEVFNDSALADACRLDAERAAGKVRGPLHGIPIAVKDLVDIKGHITGFGSLSYGAAPALTTAPFLARLQEAGMVLIGKTHMVEFAFGSWGTNAVLGTPRNPWGTHTHYIPGGSSSGSAVAVAGGLVPAAIGSDTGGSVRIPAALCGVVGLKTTTGQIDTQGVAPLSPTFDTIGPLTHWVDDAQTIFVAMRGDAESQTGVAATSVRFCRRECLQPIDAEMANAFDRSTKMLSRLGWDVSPISLSRSFLEYQADNGAIMAREAFAALRPIIEDQNLTLDPHVRARVAEGAAIDDAKYTALLEARQTAMLEFEHLLGSDEVMVLPTTPVPSRPLQEVDESIFPMSRLTRIGNYLDLCGISLPMGVTKTGLPLGLQLLAKGGQEAMLLNTAMLLESVLNAIGSNETQANRGGSD